MQILPLGIFGLPGGPEWIVILLIALLIFGRRLPDIARSVGKSIVSFKKGIRDVEDDADHRARLEDNREHRLPRDVGQSTTDSAPTPAQDDSANRPEVEVKKPEVDEKESVPKD